MKTIDHNSICISGQSQAAVGCTCHKFPVKSEPLPNLRTSYELSDAPLQGQENPNYYGFVIFERMLIIATNIILKRIDSATTQLPHSSLSTSLACGEDDTLIPDNQLPVLDKWSHTIISQPAENKDKSWDKMGARFLNSPLSVSQSPYLR